METCTFSSLFNSLRRINLGNKQFRKLKEFWEWMLKRKSQRSKPKFYKITAMQI